MIKDIQEINFPEYATLSQATVTLNDMGDRTISAQVKIDGDIAPDFSYDWEVEFQGERYILPVREPQASKGNESICSVIDLVFQHKTIYELKRYYFVEMASTGSGTAMADKYIASLTVNLKDFCVNFQNVLDYYFNGEITISLNPDWLYAEEPSFVEINYTHIWDVLQKVYEVFGVRWTIEGQTIRIGYPTEAVEHLFEYGFEGGLLRVERQVQSTDIRNSLLGRGGEKNLPYLYFKDLDKYGETGENGTWTPDPDAIPELRSIYFTELRGKTFRDYVQGWKTNPNRDLSYGDVVEEYDTYRGESLEGWAYKAGHEDKIFNPIEYVEDKESIAKYGLLQGGLENQEDIYPSIQGVEVEPYGRIDQIAGAEQVVVDDLAPDTVLSSSTMSFTDTFVGDQIETTDDENEYILRSEVIRQFEGDNIGYIISNPTIKTIVREIFYTSSGTEIYEGEEATELVSYSIIDADTNEYLNEIISIPNSIRFKVEYRVRINGIGNADRTKILSINVDWSLSSRPFAGELLENLNDDGTRKSTTISIASGETQLVTIQSDTFTIPEYGATNIDVPISITADTGAVGKYEWAKNVEAINTTTGEKVSSINLPQGTYYLRVKVEITNNADHRYSYKIDLLPSYILYPTNTEEWQPTFDIWVKNIWGTTRNEGESAEAYTERVWTPILGDREGNEAKIVFTTGWLSGHSDYEFKITNVAYAGNEGVEHDGVNAEWRITLAKSDAELEATGLYIPSTKQQANAGDHFFFIGIDMPHQYVLWAEEQLDNFKRDQLLETANIKPTWVVQTDKVRLNQLQEGEAEPLLNALKVGNSIRLADNRFISGAYETLYLQSVTYSWGTDTIMLPNVEVVLSDKVATISNPVQQIQAEINALSKQVGSLSNVQQIMRTIGDKVYLRKDGVEELCNSPIEFRQNITGRGFRQGAFGGRGWGLRTDGEKGILEVDRLVVRDDLQVNSLVSNQVTAIGGKQIESAASILCSRVDATEDGFVCYFDQKQGSISNLFQVNDIAYSQVFSPDNAQMKYYKREVIAVDANSITLSLDSDGDGMPQAGDTIVQYGNTTDTNRQYVIIRDVIGGGYERMLSDLNSVSATGTEYYFAGRMDGGTPRWFIGNAGGDYAEWKNGVLNIKGKVVFQSGSSGLANLDEWNEKQQEIDNANTNANEAKDTANEANTNANEAKETANTANDNANNAQNVANEAKETAQEAIKASEEASTVSTAIQSYINGELKGDLESLQNQIDGAIDSYFYEYDPAEDNEPASTWSDTEKEAHLNDTFTNLSTGASWRWSKNGTNYEWVVIADTATQEALKKAGDALKAADNAQQTADNKIRTFVGTDTPEPPYDEGDLWVKGASGRTMYCTKPKASGDYDPSDWAIADDSHEYTDSKVTNEINNFITGDYAKQVEEIKNQLDQKAETWYGEDDPSKDWGDDEKSLHTGDLWYNTASGKSSTWDGTKWVESDVPQSVYDKIDGKAEIFTSKPESYRKNDMWVLEKDYSTDKEGFKKGVVVFATNDMVEEFAWGDWSLKVSYTDDTRANEAINKIDNIEVGGQNLIRNSGFTGDYLSEQLADNSVLDATNEMFNPPFVHWTYSNATIQNSTESASGKEVVVVEDGNISQDIVTNIIAKENYILSFKAKGDSITFSIGGVTNTIELTSEYTRYVNKFVTVTDTETLVLSGTYTLCEVQLERGTTATAWSNSPLDNSSDRAYYQALKYVSDALTEGSTTIDGGLVLTNHIKVGNYTNGVMIKETGGMQGTWTSDNSPFLWGGGTLTQAIDTIGKYANNPSYQPKDAEIAEMAKFVVTHGGRAILNDIILRGYIYALGGEFVGMLRKRKTVIDKYNFAKYVKVIDGATHEFYSMDIEAVGSFIEIDAGLEIENFDIQTVLNIVLPTTDTDDLDFARSFIGNEILIYNYSKYRIALCNGTTCAMIDTGEVGYAKCVLSPLKWNDDPIKGTESIQWDVTTAKIRNYVTT